MAVSSGFPLPPLQLGQCFHVFFIYRTCGKDRRVVHDLVDELESRGIKCGYHEKDFIVGRNPMENLRDCLLRSLKIVVVLSPDFRKSNWCGKDLSLATTLDIERRNGPEGNIIALLNGIEERDIPFILQNLTWLDITGPKNEWLARFLRSIAYTRTEEAKCTWINFHNKLESMNDDEKFQLLKEIKMPGIQPYACQVGKGCITEVILRSCGIHFVGQLKIDLSKLHISELLTVYNEYCEEKNIKSKFKTSTRNSAIDGIRSDNENDRSEEFGNYDLSITFYEKDPCKSRKFAMSYDNLQGLTVSHDGKQMFEVKKKKQNDLIESFSDWKKLKLEKKEIHLRSKKSRRLTDSLNPSSLQTNFTGRRCLNYKNYRRVRLPFSDLDICARVTINGRLCQNANDQYGYRQTRNYISRVTETYTVLQGHEELSNKVYIY